MMEKTVKPIQPLTKCEIREIAKNAKNSSFYVLPGLLKDEIRKDVPTPEEKRNISPYVIPGLKKENLSLVPGRE